MRIMKKVFALILITSMICGIFAGMVSVVLAAAIPVNIYVDDYQSGTLDIHWDSIVGVKSVVLTYHTPDQNDNGVLNIETNNQTTNTYSINGLKSDYIYDIHVEVYDDENGAGNMIAEGLLYYLPRITFYSTRLDQERQPIPGGGYETGGNPRLNLKWMMPRVYDNDTGGFEYADTVLDNMESEINAVYSDGRNISSLNFRINVSTDSTKLNGGSSQSAILINHNGGNYEAKVSGNDDEDAVVNAIDVNGFMDFELIGRKDLESDPEAATEAYQLRDWDILPGTVYYMNIKPVFKDGVGTPVNALTSGLPSDQNGSRLSGTVEYTYTPIRFQLTRDGANNLYVKIFKINQGSLNLPRLYYEVQASDDPSIPGDWTVKKTIDDSYFTGEFAITVISGINPNNEIYYKIAVKSDSSDDRLESPRMPYTLAEDTSKPPLPMNIFIDPEARALNTDVVQHPVTNEDITVKSTDITISWDKPANWDEIDPNTGNPYKDNIVFHFLLSTSQYDLEEEIDLMVDDTVWNSYIPKYRLVKYVHGISSEINDEGSRLSYTLNAFDLFKGEYIDLGGNPVENEPINNVDAYPDFLVPNQIYFMKMYTTTWNDKGSTDHSVTSDISIIKSFTTLAGVERDVPLPDNFRLNKNEIKDGANQIEVQFERVEVDWSNYGVDTGDIYYDLYMSTRTATDSFILIGSTEGAADPGDVVWVDDPENTFVKAAIKSFDPANNPDAVALAGEGLKPNTSYYFIVKTRLDIGGPDDRESIATAILPVTTARGDINPPDPDSRRPLSPDDFAIAEDEDGNLILSGSNVEFKWSKKEEGVNYRIICTSERVAPDAEPSSYENDPVYESFIGTFGDTDNDGDDSIFALDPDTDLQPGYFMLDETKEPEEFRLAINDWVFPNRLYYFSIKAELNGNESLWVSIPVTTLLIDEPTSLEPLRDCQLGFFWTDEDVSLKAEDFRVYLKGPEDTDYKPLTASQSTIVKDGTTYYARIRNLEADSFYNVRVYKGENYSTLAYEKPGLKTRDAFHQIEVKWKGERGYKYEVAVKTDDEGSYNILKDINLEQYIDRDGNDLLYYVEKAWQTVGTNNNYYYVRIKTVPVELQDGTVVSLPLKSNTKYYVKVRAVKVDSSDTELVSYSKYAGPVDMRTEFSQDDYDEVDQENKKEAIFNDRIKQLEEGYFWRLSIDSGSATRILLKGDRIVNAIRNRGSYPFEIDISGISPNIDTNVIYIPLDVARVLNSENASLLIKVPGAEYTFRPDTIDVENNSEIKVLDGSSFIKDMFLEIRIIRTDKSSVDLPVSSQPVSRINDFDLKVVGSSKTYKELKGMIDSRLYDKDSGLISEKLNILLSNNFGSGSGDSALIEKYTSELIGLIERELSDYIYLQVNTIKISSSTRDIISYSSPMTVKVRHNGGQGLKLPYVYYDGSQSWSKITNGVARTFNTVSIDVLKTGKYVVLMTQDAVSDVPDSHPASGYIRKFIAKYDLSSVFAGINTSFYPDDKVSGKEMVLLYELVMNREDETTGLDIRQKAIKLDLDGIIGLNSIMMDINREKTAAFIIKVYCGKTGVNRNNLQPTKNIFINDEDQVSTAYYKSVLMAVDMDILPLDWKGSFRPAKSMTRADVITALVKLLEETGDL